MLAFQHEIYTNFYIIKIKILYEAFVGTKITRNIKWTRDGPGEELVHEWVGFGPT